MLAPLPDPSSRPLSAGAFPPFTDQTITALPALLGQIAGIRASGISCDREEHTTGICTAGCAVPTPDGGYSAVAQYQRIRAAEGPQEARHPAALVYRVPGWDKLTETDRPGDGIIAAPLARSAQNG